LKRVAEVLQEEAGGNSNPLADFQEQIRSKKKKESDPEFNPQYKVALVDVGKPLSDVIEKSKTARESDLPEEDRLILKQMIIPGYASKQFKIGEEIPVIFRTISGEGVQNAWKVLFEEIKGDVPAIVQRNYVKMMHVAKHLQLFGEHSWESDDFEEPDFIKERYEFVKKLPANMIDVLAEMQTAFLDDVERTVSAVKIQNF